LRPASARGPQIDARFARRSGAERARSSASLASNVVNVDAREDSMRAVWTHIEYGRDLNPEVGFEATKSEVDDSVTIDGIDMLAAIVLVELARQPLERDHAGSVEEFPRFDVGVVVVIVEIGTFAEAWVRTAIGPKQENPPGPGEQ